MTQLKFNLRSVFSDSQSSKHPPPEWEILNLCITWMSPHTSVIRDPLSLTTALLLSVCSHSQSPCPVSPDTGESPSTKHAPPSLLSFTDLFHPCFNIYTGTKLSCSHNISPHLLITENSKYLPFPQLHLSQYMIKILNGSSYSVTDIPMALKIIWRSVMITSNYR